jgi:hypothetical protein
MIDTSSAARTELPYGVAELDPVVQRDPSDPDLVRCFVHGCNEWVRRVKRGTTDQYCPIHGIRLHAAQGFNPTYGYADVSRNVIVGVEDFISRGVGHPYKYDSNKWRLASENSEDTLSWNVFRSFSDARLLGPLVQAFLVEESSQEPDLYLWGIRINDGSFQGWDLLDRARQRFESQLPVRRPYTEPDIALHLPGHYLILIEAKFGSPNTTYVPGDRQEAQDLTFAELLSIYHDPELRILDHDLALRQSQIHYQLWRNLVFAEWMAACESPDTRAYHVNLVREGYESEAAKTFAQLVRPEYSSRFRQWTWESLHRGFCHCPEMSRCARYLENKTYGLRPAFRLGASA